MSDEHSIPELQQLLALAPGDQVEAGDDRGGIWKGTVETAAPEHGVVWLRTTTGERKLFDIYEHTIERRTVADDRTGQDTKNPNIPE